MFKPNARCLVTGRRVMVISQPFRVFVSKPRTELGPGLELNPPQRIPGLMWVAAVQRNGVCQPLQADLVAPEEGEEIVDGSELVVA